MERRAFVGTVATLLAGCTTSANESTETTTTVADDADVMEPTYLGVHDDHSGPSIEAVEYQVHNACKATVMVWFEDVPQKNRLAVWFYKNGEEVDRGTQKIAELDMSSETRENFEFQFCTIDKYDSFRVGVIE